MLKNVPSYLLFFVDPSLSSPLSFIPSVFFPLPLSPFLFPFLPHFPNSRGLVPASSSTSVSLSFFSVLLFLLPFVFFFTCLDPSLFLSPSIIFHFPPKSLSLELRHSVRFSFSIPVPLAYKEMAQ